MISTALQGLVEVGWIHGQAQHCSFAPNARRTYLALLTSFNEFVLGRDLWTMCIVARVETNRDVELLSLVSEFGWGGAPVTHQQLSEKQANTEPQEGGGDQQPRAMGEEDDQTRLRWQERDAGREEHRSKGKASCSCTLCLPSVPEKEVLFT